MYYVCIFHISYYIMMLLCTNHVLFCVHGPYMIRTMFLSYHASYVPCFYRTMHRTYHVSIVPCIVRTMFLSYPYTVRTMFLSYHASYVPNIDGFYKTSVTPTLKKDNIYDTYIYIYQFSIPPLFHPLSVKDTQGCLLPSFAMTVKK